MQDARPEFLTVEQVAELLQVSIKTIYRWIRAEQIPYLRIGHEYRINKKSLEKLNFIPTGVH